MGLSRSTFYDPASAALDVSEVLARIGAICDEFECYRCRGHGTQYQATEDAWLANACRDV